MMLIGSFKTLFSTLDFDGGKLFPRNTEGVYKSIRLVAVYYMIFSTFCGTFKSFFKALCSTFDFDGGQLFQRNTEGVYKSMMLVAVYL